MGPTWGPPGSCRPQLALCWPHEPSRVRKRYSPKHPVDDFSLAARDWAHLCYLFVNQLLNTVQYLMVAYDKHKKVDVAVLDVPKAFDVVPRHRLLGKLQHYSINNHILKWISEFMLMDWLQAGLPLSRGAAGDRALALFLLHINDLPDCMESPVRLFADDFLLYITI